MNVLELINIEKVRKAILYLLFGLVCLWVQTMVLSRVRLLGVSPFFIPALAVAIGMFEDGVWGGAFGVVLGAYCDLCFTDSTVLFLILFAVLGFVAGMLTRYFINRRFFSYLVLAVPALLLTAGCQILPLLVFRGDAPGPLFGVAALQCLTALPFAAAAYAAVRRIAGRAQPRP